MTDLTVLVSPMPLPMPAAAAPPPSSPFISAFKRRSYGLGLGRFGKSAAELGKQHPEGHGPRASKSAVDLAADTIDGLDERGRIDSRRCSGKGIMVTLERDLDSDDDDDPKPSKPRGRAPHSDGDVPEHKKNKKQLRLASFQRPKDPLMYPRPRPNPKSITSYDPGLLSPPPPGFRPRHRPSRSRSAPPTPTPTPTPAGPLNADAIGHGTRPKQDRPARVRMSTVPAPPPCDFDAYMRGDGQTVRGVDEEEDEKPSRYAEISSSRGLTEYERMRAFAEWERKQAQRARRRTGEEVGPLDLPELSDASSSSDALRETPRERWSEPVRERWSEAPRERERWRAATEFEIPYPRSPDMDDDAASCRSTAFSDTTFNRNSFGPGDPFAPFPSARIMQRRSLTTPCAGELVRPEPPLLRPSPFWRHTPRSGVTPLAYAPGSALVRRSTFIAAGLDLAPGTKGDLRALCVDARVREKSLIAPPTGIEGVGV
ncbi:hypothetical protein BD626DRAFT_565874 [Schizophyllum amplum]|uniref:Uncharacterized protein n=1 Tax=Schizophyllum amplum TaxID=97359 RepID=A0A550CPY0_9AGAR|nr:hypothetical protein BD626DRAFT_565874 [Auriculariopsis ampla]